MDPAFRETMLTNERCLHSWLREVDCLRAAAAIAEGRGDRGRARQLWLQARLTADHVYGWLARN
jgi:hypothetical protein